MNEEKNVKIAAAADSSAAAAAEAIKFHFTSLNDAFKKISIMIQDLDKLKEFDLEKIHCRLSQLSQTSCIISGYIGEYSAYYRIKKLSQNESIETGPKDRQ